MGDTISFMLKSATGQILPAMASTLKKGRAYAIDKGVEESVLLVSAPLPRHDAFAEPVSDGGRDASARRRAYCRA